MPLQIRRGTEAERQSAVSLVPQSGELVWITDTEQLYIGDGTNQLKNLSPITGYTDEFAIDAVGQALSGGTHSGITFTYGTAQDAADRIDATINPTQSLTNLTVTGNTTLSTTTISGTLSVTGKLIADFNGSIHADDSTLLVDGVDAKINLDGTVKGNIIPDVTEAYDIGSSSLKFRDMYLSGTSLYLGAAQITSTGLVINLPAGSTIDGEVIQAEVSEESAFVRDLKGSVFGDDSTLLVDSIASQIVGTVNNTTTTSQDLNAGVVILSGQGSTGQKAGLKIVTDGDADDNYDLLTINCSVGTDVGPAIVFERSRGTPSAPTAVVSGDEVMAMNYFAYDSTNTPAEAATIAVTTEGTIGSGITPAKIEFFTNNASGTKTLGLGISSSQLLTVAANTTTANSGSGTADVSGGVATYLKINIGGTTYAIPAYALVP